MKYGFVGVGALGGYYAGLLERSGKEVHYLWNSDYDVAVAQGLRVDSIHGDFRVPATHSHARPEDMPLLDVVCVSLKATRNHLLPQILERISRPGGAILVMQNGYGLEQELAVLFPDRVILGGLCFLCAERVGPAHVQHLDYGSVRIGPLVRDGRETPFMAALAADFATAGIETHLLQDLLLARWQKLMWNIPFNGLCALLGANTLELLENADSYALVAEMMAEVQSGAAACGVELSDAFVEKMLRDTRKMVPYKPSMQLDHEAGRPLEWEAIYQKPIEAAQANGALMPKCETLMRQLAFLSRER